MNENMMSMEPTPEEREQLERITAAWEEYDRTRDPAVIADYLAEDIMFLPPGSSPIEGKAAALDALEDADGESDPDLDQWGENIFVSGNLAVVHGCVATTPDNADEQIDGGTTGLDAYRREEDGEWRQIISIWNDQI